MDSWICDNCGDEFNPVRNDRSFRYCSPKCRDAHRNKQKLINDRDWWTPIDGIPPRVCPICSKTFYSNRRKYCSEFCSYKAVLKQRRNTHQIRKRKLTVQGFIARRCPECTLLFVTNQLIRKFCSEECWKKHHGNAPMKKREVCKHIYDTRNDPDSISDLIEDLSGISCDRKIRDEKEGRETKSSYEGPWEISSTPRGLEEGCVVCGLIRDKNGKYCKCCWTAMGKRRYISHVVEALREVDVSVEQKRKCLSCAILPRCIEADNVHDGCDTTFKLINREAKKKIRSLARVTRQRQGGS